MPSRRSLWRLAAPRLQWTQSPELMNILTEAVADLVLDWAAPVQPSKCWMDGSFLGASRQADVQQRPAPFFPELHEELTCSWCFPHSAQAHAQGTQLLTTVEGAEKNGYMRPPPIEDAVAAHLVHSGVGKPPHCLLSHVEPQLTSLKRRIFLQDTQHLPSI